VGKVLLVAGLIIAALGALMMLGLPLGRLPGDITIRRGNGTFYFPIVTCLVLSVLFTLLMSLLRRWDSLHMAIKADRWIKKMAREHGMIEPFEERQVRAGVVSYGLSSYGYDIRVADEFKVFTNINNTLIDPKNFDPRSFVDIKADTCIVPPNSFALARTIEYFRIPRDVLTVCLGKSTYARCGIIVNVTPFEPEWEGTATLEISNTTPLPAVIYANEGIAQVLFFQSDEPCEISYGDKKGKYLKQQEVTLPRI
jgi:dCTP deaminase